MQTRQPAEPRDIKIGMKQMQSFVMINKVRVREMGFDGGVVTKVAMFRKEKFGRKRYAGCLMVDDGALARN